MALFNGKRKRDTATEEATDAKLAEELQELSAVKNSKEVVKARTEAEQAISNATRADIRGLAMLEKGRCPECGGRTETFLFSSVCPACGWFRRSPESSGRCVIQLDGGEEVRCDRVYDVRQGLLLCVRDNVVCSQIAREHVRRIDFELTEEELRDSWDRFRKDRKGICSWCESQLREAAEEGAPFEEYVAFGANQERYTFCSLKCLSAFRKQYPVRIHRNCYETDCNLCNKCNKRFDTTGFTRVQI
jgi:hypothetical protein